METVIPYGVAYNHFHIQNIEPELKAITSDFIYTPNYVPCYYFYDLNSNGTVALCYSQDDANIDQVLTWNIGEATNYALIPAPDGLIDAQFSITRPDTILAIIGSDLIEYDISADPIEINRTPLGIPDIRAAYFSPDQTHVAIVSDSEYDGYFIVNVLSLPPIQTD